MNPLRWYRAWRAAQHMRRYTRITRVLVDTDVPLSAFQIAKHADLMPGSLYPWLAAWERTGVVVATWEPGPYPRRRVYRLSASGRAVASSHGIRPVGAR